MSGTAGAGHTWHLLHLAGATFAWAVRLLPRRWRFEAALLGARLAEPLVRRTAAYRNQERTRVDRAAEIAVHFVMHTLTTNGVSFEPTVALHGYEGLVWACAEGQGVLLAAPHTALGLLQVRFFHEDGLAPIIITSDPLMRVAGTRIFVETLQPAPNFLVATRNRLRAGRLVGAMLDRGAHHGERTFEIETANGPVIVAPALLQVAARCGARVVFMEVHLDGRELAGSFVVASSDTAEGLTREYIAFVQSHVDERFGPGGATERTWTTRRASPVVPPRLAIPKSIAEHLVSDPGGR